MKSQFDIHLRSGCKTLLARFAATLVVAPDIIEDLLGSGEGAFGVHHPLHLSKRCKIARPGVGIAEGLERAGHVQRAGGERRVEVLEKESAEETRQDADRQEEPGPTRDPAGAVGGETAAGDDTGKGDV